MGQNADKQPKRKARSKHIKDVVSFEFDYRPNPRTQLHMAKKKPAKKKAPKKKAARKDYVQTAWDVVRKSTEL